MLAAVIAGAFVAPALTHLAIGIAQALAGIAVLAAAAVAYIRLSRRGARIGEALRLAADRDAMWDEATLKKAIAALFDAYWAARASGNLLPVADALTQHHRDRLDTHTRRGDKTVGRTARLLDIRIIGVHDVLDDRQDRFEALLRCSTDIHRVSRFGEIREGAPGLVNLHQRWQFVRDTNRWLLNDVRQTDVAAALGSSQILVEHEHP